MSVPLTVVIPTLNEEGQIGAALEALRWADEVIVADGGSSDRTAELARGRGAAVIEVRGKSIGAQRNAAIARARNEWVLALDADERVTDALCEELGRVLAAPAHQAYRVRCENYFLGRERKRDRKSTRLNSSHLVMSYAVFCLKKKTQPPQPGRRCAGTLK